MEKKTRLPVLGPVPSTPQAQRRAEIIRLTRAKSVGAKGGVAEKVESRGADCSKPILDEE